MKMEAQSTENVFETFLNVCGSCKESLQSKDAKLLPCLHTFCKPCLLELSDGVKVRCTTCQGECQLNEVILNHFVNQGSSSEGAEPSAVVTECRTCTACDEQVAATSYCQECAEWLCDQCVQAHRRVRVTKDHTILPKDSVASHDEATPGSSERLPFCPIHKQEVLRLYCETCDKLTCRDCQLLEHKEHRYQFVSEAAIHYKQFLSTLLSKLKEKRTYIENAKTLINRRYQEIAEREKLVTNDIKTFAVRLITEINKRGKKLLMDLNSVCSAKKRQLGHKHSEILALSSKLDHALKFAGYVLEHHSNSAVLDSKKVLINQLKHVLRTRCEVPNPYHVVDIRLKADSQFLLTNIASQGTLIVDGVAYQASHGGMPTGQEQIPMTQLPAITPPSMPVPQGRKTHSLPNLTPEQRLMLMKKLAQMNRQATASSSIRTSSSSTQPLSHFSSSPQSSMVSSTNTQQQIMNKYGMRLPTQTGGMINLAQLQQQRLQRLKQQKQQQQHNPIIIAPKSPNSASYPGPSSDGVSAFSREPIIGTIFKPEASERPSCSYAAISPKKEPVSIMDPAVLDLSAQDLNFDADPESLAFLDSLKKEAESCLADNEDIIPLEIAPVSEHSSLNTTPPPVAESSQEGSEDNQHSNQDSSQDSNQDSNQLASAETSMEEHREESEMANPPELNEDPSEDYCACCHNGGDLLCCDFCPKVFHLLCHVPVLHASPSGTWQCGLCRSESSFILLSPPPREEDATPVGSKRKLPVGLSEKEQRTCERLLLELFCHEASVPFHEPVPKSVPGYYKVIAKPMDFMTIRNKLCRQHFNRYKTVEDFASDVKLVFSNCQQYNSPSSEVGQAGKVVELFFAAIMKKYLPYVDLSAAIATKEHPEKAKKRKKEGTGRKSPSSKGRRSLKKGLRLSAGKEEGETGLPTCLPLEDDSTNSSRDNQSPGIPPRPQSADASLPTKKLKVSTPRRASHEGSTPHREHMEMSLEEILPKSPVFQDDDEEDSNVSSQKDEEGATSQNDANDAEGIKTEDMC